MRHKNNQRVLSSPGQANVFRQYAALRYVRTCPFPYATHL